MRPIKKLKSTAVWTVRRLLEKLDVHSIKKHACTVVKSLKQFTLYINSVLLHAVLDTREHNEGELIIVNTVVSRDGLIILIEIDIAQEDALNKVCPNCKKVFRAKNRLQCYCSHECQEAGQRANKREQYSMNILHANLLAGSAEKLL